MLCRGSLCRCYTLLDLKTKFFCFFLRYILFWKVSIVMKIHPPTNLQLIRPTVLVVDRKSKNNVVAISIISRCPSLSRCLVLPDPCGYKKKKDISILRLARSIFVCKWHQWHKVGEKDQRFFSSGNSTLNTFLACMFFFPNRPYACSHSRGTRPKHLRAKVVLGQDKQRKLPLILKVYMPFVCLSQCAFCSPA